MSDAVGDSYEMNCHVRLKNAPACVPWWNRKLCKLSFEVIKHFNGAKKCTLNDRERFKETQCIYKKMIVVAKGNSWKTLRESIYSDAEASKLHIILSKETNVHLGCLKLPNGSYTESMEEPLNHLMKVHFLRFQGSSRARGNGK
jgi:ribosomal protein L30E